MVKIKTKNWKIEIDNPWITIEDVPVFWVRIWNWIRSHPSSIKRLILRTFEWQSWRKWFTGVFLGFCGGVLATWGVLYLFSRYFYG